MWISRGERRIKNPDFREKAGGSTAAAGGRRLGLAEQAVWKHRDAQGGVAPALFQFAHLGRIGGVAVLFGVAKRVRCAPGSLQLYGPVFGWTVSQPHPHEKHGFATGHAAQVHGRALVGQGSEIYLRNAVGGPEGKGLTGLQRAIHFTKDLI